MDTVPPSKRSQIMAQIRAKDTRPELVLRHCLHQDGFRYRLHDRKLPGSPDLVFRRFRSVCFVHGCFWHRHAGCSRTTTPSTRRDYWETKFESNIARDQRTRQTLIDLGWRVAVVWECALRRKHLDSTVAELERWLESDELEFETQSE